LGAIHNSSRLESYTPERESQPFSAEWHLKYGNLLLNSWSYVCNGKVRVATLKSGQKIVSLFGQEQNIGYGWLQKKSYHY
jgi:hypothetical protein